MLVCVSVTLVSSWQSFCHFFKSFFALNNDLAFFSGALFQALVASLLMVDHVIFEFPGSTSWNHVYGEK